MRRRFLLLWIALLLWPFGTFSPEAASIFVADRNPDFTIIVIDGEITFGDDERFEGIALSENKAIVILSSPGGLADPALRIGRTIRLRSFVTAVRQGSDCASACGIIWLGGVKRIVMAGGRVGFHAAYRRQNGAFYESGKSNALVGAYLNQLGLTPTAIGYLTETSPDSMGWLTEEAASILGIEAVFETRSASGSPQKPNDPKPEEESGAASPVTNSRDFVRIAGRDIYGFDLDGKSPGARSAEECESRCRQDHECKAYSYNSRRKQCFLKHGGDLVLWNKEVAAGYLPEIETSLRMAKIAVFSGTNLKGEEYRYKLDSKTEECVSLCEADNRCSGFTFSRKQQGRCSLRRGKLKRESREGILAGVKTRE
ncbi:MAG: PAN domain-containing protein [Aestuariivirga sp.]